MSTLAMQDFRTAMLMKSGIFMQRAICIHSTGLLSKLQLSLWTNLTGELSVTSCGSSDRCGTSSITFTHSSREGD